MAVNRDKLLAHLEEPTGAGHVLRFEPWTDSLPVEALVSVHDQDHRVMEALPHPEGDHTHPYGYEDFEDQELTP